jgi:hypothetical protein
MSLDLRAKARQTDLTGSILEASWETDIQSHGAPWTQGSGAFHKGAEEYTWLLHTAEYPLEIVKTNLSQILQANAPEKYYLSSRACQGIMNRAEHRGKELPKMLKEALLQMIEGEKATTSPLGMSKEDWMM